MTKHHLLSTALLVVFGLGGLSAIRATELKTAALTKKELKTAIASAKSAEDHHRIAVYFKEQADQLLAEAKEHDELAALYGKSPNPLAIRVGRSAEHCKYIAEYIRKAAHQDRELAKLHEEMANQAAK